jgi:hypothetical protein
MTGGPAKSGAVSVRAIEGVVEDQKSEGTRRDSRVGRNFLVRPGCTEEILKGGG